MGTLSADTALIEKRIDQLIQALIKNFGDRTYSSIDYDVTTGAKYYKIHHIDSGGGRSVHAFVSRQTGAVYKPASCQLNLDKAFNAEFVTNGPGDATINVSLDQPDFADQINLTSFLFS